MSNWTKISDSILRHVWRCPECGKTVTVDPSFYGGSGEPVCEDCDIDMDYSHTEILEKNAIVHVRGGVAYAPNRKSNGVTVVVVDHDNH